MGALKQALGPEDVPACPHFAVIVYTKYTGDDTDFPYTEHWVTASQNDPDRHGLEDFLKTLEFSEFGPRKRYSVLSVDRRLVATPRVSVEVG